MSANEAEARLLNRSIYDSLAPRCACGKLLAVGLTRPFWIRCSRCGADVRED